MIHVKKSKHDVCICDVECDMFFLSSSISPGRQREALNSMDHPRKRGVISPVRQSFGEDRSQDCSHFGAEGPASS